MVETLDPSSLTNRSFLYRQHIKSGAVFAELGGFAVPLNYGNPDSETEASSNMGLVDLSHLPRTGFKGWDAAKWVISNGCKVGDVSNITTEQACYSRAMRLAPSEVAILGDLNAQSSLVNDLDMTWSSHRSDGVFHVPRANTNCWLKVTGKYAPSMFAKICAVDLRPQVFGIGKVAQTNIARLNCIVVRHDIEAVLTYDILTDCASADYFWSALLDAMEEFSGKPIGISALKSLSVNI